MFVLLKTHDTRVSGNVVLATERQYIDDELVVAVEQRPDSGAEMQVLCQMCCPLLMPASCVSRLTQQRAETDPRLEF